MILEPANDDEEYVYGTLDASFSDLLDALSADGADVQCGVLDTDAGTFTPTNDL